MRDYDLKTLYSQSLGIKAPWKIASVTRTEDEIHIRVGCSKRATWTDPETKQRALIKDWHERTWRHMDTCECKTLVTCRVPRIDSGPFDPLPLPMDPITGELSKKGREYNDTTDAPILIKDTKEYLKK